MRRLAVVAVFLVACGILPAHAQTIALAFKQGDTYTYALHLAANLNINAGTISQEVKIDAKAKESVAVNSVESDGTADTSLTVSGLTITTTGKAPDGSTSTTTTTNSSAIPPQQLKVAPDGRILAVNGESVSAESPFGVLVGSNLAYAVLPDTAVKPGDKWTKSYDQSQPGGQSSVHVTSNSTYLRDESFHGVNAAVIETKSTAAFTMSFDSLAPAPNMPNPPNVPNAQPGVQPTPVPPGVGGVSMQGTVTSDTTSWVDPAARRVLKSMEKADLKSTISGLASGTAAAGALAGGVTITGTQSLDLEPA